MFSNQLILGSVSCVNAEPLGGEDDPDPGPESSRHLPLVWSGQERAGECVWWNKDEDRIPIHTVTRETLFYFCRLQFRVMPTNTKVLIRVITLNNSNSRGHEFGDTGHVSLPPLDRLNFILNIQLLCFDYQQVQFPELIVVLGIFYQYLLCFLSLKSFATQLHVNPLKSFLSWIFSLRSRRSGRISFKCFLKRMQNITWCVYT